MKRSASDRDVVNGVMAVPGVLHVKRHFRQAKAPGARETVRTPDGKSVHEPDLTRWHAVGFSESEDVYTKIEDFTHCPSPHHSPRRGDFVFSS